VVDLGEGVDHEPDQRPVEETEAEDDESAKAVSL
jgi:hypothetical protein